MYITQQYNYTQLEPVIREVDSIDSTGYRNQRIPLVVSVEHLDSLIRPLIWAYDQQYGYPGSVKLFKEPRGLRLEDCWVNFVGPGEATPIHNHGGVMSWCLWLRVPYSRQEEIAARPWVPAANNINGEFAFHTVADQGRIQTIPLGVDRTWERTLAIWPAHTYHSVFPFHSTDQLRVSVAGNYWFDV